MYIMSFQMDGVIPYGAWKPRAAGLGRRSWTCTVTHYRGQRRQARALVDWVLLLRGLVRVLIVGRIALFSAGATSEFPWSMLCFLPRPIILRMTVSIRAVQRYGTTCSNRRP